ncbi:hypothetical protein B0H11DRAFT_1286316 [Mycena galericulata]|nr:hypothetical protein B0H11DRAFT_1286316 [Mycena galericulata]
MVHLFVRDAEDYFDLVFHKELWGLVHTLWIDRSNGRLCIDLISDRLQWNSPPSSQSLRPTAPGIDTDMLLNEYHMLFPPLTPEQYHFITWFHCSNTFSPYQDGPLPPIHVASILWSSEGSEALHVEDANNPVIIPTNPVIMFWPWTMRGKAMANGWERYESNKFADMSISINFDGPESWLSQANHIFDQLNVASKKETYALVESVTFELFVTRPGFDRRSGYLFVCPPDDFRLPGSSSFRWPDCPAYWSIDPTGAERLTTEAARLLGFPILEFRTRVKLSSWDDTVYTGLREFHESRGFDPDSQDMARHLGHLIYKVSDGESSTTDDEDSCDSPIQALNENTIEELPSVDLSTLYGPEDMLPLSRTSKFLMVVKLALVLFIALSCAYNGVRAQLN